jgi:hypothetical protein
MPLVACRPCQQAQSWRLLVPLLRSQAPLFHEVVRYHDSRPQTGSAVPLPRTQHGSRLDPPPNDFYSEDDLARTCPVQVHDTINNSQSATWLRAGPAVSLLCRQHAPRQDPPQEYLALDGMRATQKSYLGWLVAEGCCRKPVYDRHTHHGSCHVIDAWFVIWLQFWLSRHCSASIMSLDLMQILDHPSHYDHGFELAQSPGGCVI